MLLSDPNSSVFLYVISYLFVQTSEEGDSLYSFTQSHLVSKDGVSAVGPGIT